MRTLQTWVGSAGPYLHDLGKWGLSFLGGSLVSAIALVLQLTGVWSGNTVPKSVLWAGLFVGLLVGPFIAYHRLRLRFLRESETDELQWLIDFPISYGTVLKIHGLEVVARWGEQLRSAILQTEWESLVVRGLTPEVQRALLDSYQEGKPPEGNVPLDAWHEVRTRLGKLLVQIHMRNWVDPAGNRPESGVVLTVSGRAAVVAAENRWRSLSARG